MAPVDARPQAFAAILAPGRTAAMGPGRPPLIESLIDTIRNERDEFQLRGLFHPEGGRRGRNALAVEGGDRNFG